MAIDSLALSSFNAIYLGIAGATGTLIKFQGKKKSNVVISDVTPRVYVPSEAAFVQAGPHSVSVSITFIADSDLVWKVSRGIPLTGTVNDAPTMTRYCLFLMSNNKVQKKSFWFPNLGIESALNAPYDGVVTEIPIKFVIQDRDLSTLLIAKGTYSDLKTAYLSSRLPTFY